MKAISDTAEYVGHNCQICGRKVFISKGHGLWRRVGPLFGRVEAYHMRCLFP